MVGHRRAPDEFLPARCVVIQTPVTADSAFQETLPRLVERLDQIEGKAVLLAALEHIGKDARLRGGRRQRAFTHPAGARPAELADHDFLAGKIFRDKLADRTDMVGGFIG